MKYSTFTSKGIAVAISFFAIFTCFTNSINAQAPETTNSSCFSVSAVRVTDGTQCNTSECGPNPFATHQCDKCVDVTITCDRCPGLKPTTFIIRSISNSECHSVCSPTLDFSNSTEDRGPNCSWNNPRTLYYNNINGIPDGNSATFRICYSSVQPPQTYHIQLPAGTYCNGVLCTDALVYF